MPSHQMVGVFNAGGLDGLSAIIDAAWLVFCAPRLVKLHCTRRSGLVNDAEQRRSSGPRFARGGPEVGDQERAGRENVRRLSL